MRLGALIRAKNIHPETLHFRGLPLEAGGQAPRRPLGWPVCAIIEERPDGVFLIRYDGAGEEVGDTWHASIEDAREQAVAEYGDALDGWCPVPPDVADVDLEGHLLRSAQ